MPYIEVWVDDEPCDGTCEGAKNAHNLQGIIDEAKNHLRNGDQEAALSVLDADIKSPEDIKARYNLWRSRRLPGFANYVQPNA